MILLLTSPVKKDKWNLKGCAQLVATVTVSFFFSFLCYGVVVTQEKGL